LIGSNTCLYQLAGPEVRQAAKPPPNERLRLDDAPSFESELPREFLRP
jgi:hypothetical protein